MKLSLYPQIQIDRIKKPNRWYAVPLLGFLIKLIMVIPVALELWVLGWAQFAFSMLNACNIFFRGRYWKMAYDLNLGIFRLQTNMSYFLFGLTDVYPGYSLKTTNYDLDLSYNKTPSRVLATPLLGVVFRFVLMIPYIIYRHILSLAATLAVLVGWIWVLFQGRYPETVYEIVRDSVRVDIATSAYFLGMSDDYPSFWMSFNHKALKILLLALAVLFSILSFMNNGNNWNKHQQKNMQYPTTTASSSTSMGY